nr:hypothetical protein [Streptomyces tardus]
MTGGGFARQPDGSVIVALSVPRPCGPGGDSGGQVRVLVHAVNRPRALTRLRNLGLRAVYLRGNTDPPTPDEVTAVLHHPEGLLWRSSTRRGQASWQPIAALLRPSSHTPAGRASSRVGLARHPVAQAVRPRACR